MTNDKPLMDDDEYEKFKEKAKVVAEATGRKEEDVLADLIDEWSDDFVNEWRRSLNLQFWLQVAPIVGVLLIFLLYWVFK